MGNEWMLWDLLALIIIAGCVFFAAKRGFVQTIISFFSYIAAAVAANIMSTPAAEWLYENLLGDFIKSALTGSLRETIAKRGGANEFALNAPLWLRGVFSLMPEEGLNALDLNKSAAVAVERFVDESLRDPVIWLVSGIVFLFLFVMLAFLIKQFARLFTFVDRIPIIGTINTVLGGVLGAAQAVIILTLIVIVAHVTIVLSDSSLPWINHTVFEQSFLIRFFYTLTKF